MGAYHISALLAHQAAEQSLKGLWIEAGEGLPPRTHNLVDLATGVRAPERVVTACALLGPHYMASRYPDVAEGNPANNYTAQSAGVLVAHASEVFEWCLSQLAS